jgi:phosphatidylglycerophosphate synthase
MTAEELVSEQEAGYPTLRFIADLLTLTRLAIAITIVCLGLLLGPEALRAAIILVFVGWLTDTLDGPLARRSGTSQTRVSRVDVPADNALIFSFFLFLVITGLYPVLPALALAAGAGLIVLLRPTYSAVQMVSAPFFALPIVLSFCAGWLVGVIYVVFITVMFISRWDRLTADARNARDEAASINSPAGGEG